MIESAPILAAVITAVVSFVALIVTKEQKVSEFRQAWIDALREDLAEFSAQARLIALYSQTSEPFVHLSTPPALPSHPYQSDPVPLDPLLENRRRLADRYYAIRLRLNPDEPDHQAVSELLDEIYGIINTSEPVHRYFEALDKLETVSSSAQNILKKEWRRVKKGEPVYRVTWILFFGLFVVFLVLVAMLFIRPNTVSLVAIRAHGISYLLGNAVCGGSYTSVEMNCLGLTRTHRLHIS